MTMRKIGTTLTALLGLAAALALPQARAAARSGEEVFAAVCSACHATGANGAPKVGDESAWSARAAQGLTSLTRHAIEGIRNMPAHGGNPGVSDHEIELAITYMVNRSGGHWAAPIDKSAPAAERSGERIVRAQCVKCHATGVDGAPRIGDRAAWIPRMEYGIEALVRSAVNGHGGMPARGGMADLTDSELRGAVVYMIDQGVAPAAAGAPAAPASAARSVADHQVVAGTEIYLGVFSARALREENPKPRSTEAAMHGGIPRGRGYYHLNVSLFDSRTSAPIADAQVEVTVSDPVTGGETRALELMATPNAPSYGGYFRISGANPHLVTVRIRRPGVASPIVASFDFGR